MEEDEMGIILHTFFSYPSDQSGCSGLPCRAGDADHLARRCFQENLGVIR